MFNVQFGVSQRPLETWKKPKEVLLAPCERQSVIVQYPAAKQIEVESIFPDEIEKYPWAGHLGIKLAHKIIPIIEQSKTTLIFINTRAWGETWYHLAECLSWTCRVAGIAP